MGKFLKKGFVIVTIFSLIIAGCGQKMPNNENEIVETENTVTDSVKGSKVFADATEIVLSDEVITVDGSEISFDEAATIYAAKDIVFYLEGQGFTYGEGEKSDEHSQEEADAHTVVHITQPGTYVVSGTLSAGQIAIDLGKDAKKNPEAIVTLILNGVDITCSVAPAIIFYNVYECGDKEEESATKDVDTSAAGANVLIADESVNYVTGSYVARIYKPQSVELNEAGTEVESAKKLHKYDAAFYSKMSMNMNGDELGNGILNIKAENEGLGSELHLTINGGNINIASGNDGINTNEDGVSVTTMNGGTLKIKVTGKTGEGDGVDSNGWLVINGGTLISQACSFSRDAGIDSDMGIHINGGTVIATGNMLDRIAESSQNYAVFNFASDQKDAGAYTLKNEKGETVIEASFENSFTYLIVSSAELVPGTYTMWNGGKQLAASAGDMKSGMMGGFGDGRMPEGVELPEGMEKPEGMTSPEGLEKPEGMTPPEGMEKLEGMTPPEGLEKPEDMTPPEGEERQEGGREGFGGFGSTENAELSNEFVISVGGNYFNSVSIAE